jgi:ribosome-associated toxin RatA of RatAB toxin-antitoxin module
MNERLAGSILCAAALLAGALAAAGSVSFSEQEMATLAEGKVVRQELPSSRENGFYGGSGYIVVDAPPERVWKTLVDWNNYPEVFPNTISCREISRKDNRSLIKMKLGHPVISVTYHLEMRLDEKSRTLSFDQVSSHPSDLDDIRGYWRLFPQKNDRTLIAYVVAFQVPMGIVNLVGGNFENYAVRGILGVPKYVKKWMESHPAQPQPTESE